MTEYKFNFGMADQTRDEMARINQKMQTMLAELDKDIRKSLDRWEGSAKAQYEISQQKWNAAAAEMPKCLHRAEVSLENISGGYLKVEHTGANTWGG